MSLTSILTALSQALLIGGLVVGYNVFQNEKMQFENEKFLENKLDSLPSQTARILLPILESRINETMVKAGLVDYDLIFKSDSISSANIYNKIINSNKALLKSVDDHHFSLMDSLIKERVQLEKIKVVNSIFKVTYGKTTIYFEWKYNPKNDTWELIEIQK